MAANLKEPVQRYKADRLGSRVAVAHWPIVVALCVVELKGLFSRCRICRASRVVQITSQESSE
ncbi:hypothetical protein Geob_2836 [Geotalea daltonii FRC-32]|uniref:Uncharacterized protein n=1 Tax=Geotalea daltonii (strain DSM 22248 / JCM 15807 / FRC-32) TaxID=316067 RepID=B9M263_GEODF|nr:hypothetical protein Geob_2836 [Geotalea daltonii FRC-32]